MKMILPFGSLLTWGMLGLFLSMFQMTFSQGFEGYYRHPDIYENTIVFVAEGDLWTVSTDGGIAARLTSHPEQELFPHFSPDGKTIGFSASYEGPQEAYSIPVQGGLPIRWTYEGPTTTVNGWTPDGKLLYDTYAYSTLPDRQLVTVDITSKKKERIPLHQASEGSYTSNGKTVFFVRPSDHRNVTKRYKGGTARQIWSYKKGAKEAVKLTKDYTGESHHPMAYQGRVYFISDRDGVMNIWSMDESGEDVKQHTQHKRFDVRYANLQGGKVVYQSGADIWLLNIASGAYTKVPIRISSDLDQLREKWVNDPMPYVSSGYTDHDGQRVVMTVRGKIFVLPLKNGRMVSFAEKSNVRYREARFTPDGKSILALSDESGEFEWVKLPANGIGEETALTSDGKVLRTYGIPSPDGNRIAYEDVDNHLWILTIESGKSELISTNEEGIRSYAWSPDSKWLAFVQNAENTMAQIHIHDAETNTSFPLTTDRANSTFPTWSPDGKFIYFLSDRNFNTLVGSPWGTRQPEPYFDASEKLYHVPLQAGSRSPFRPIDELFSEPKEEKKEKAELKVSIDKEAIQRRIAEVPIKPGNYSQLSMNGKALYMISAETGVGAKRNLAAVKISSEKPKAEIIVPDVNGYSLSGDGKQMLVRKGKGVFVIPAATSKAGNLSKGRVNMSNLKFSIDPREDWKQLFIDAWRMERDYFYDPNMHGVDWDAMRADYEPLVARVTTREELSDLIGRFVGELSALHTSVRGGDRRSDKQNVGVASLGARLMRDDKKGGFVIEHIYMADPDYPDERSPLDDPYQDIQEGDVITHVNGTPTLQATEVGELIRGLAGQQVLITVKHDKQAKDYIVQPIGNDYALRYRDWEYSRRLEVEEKSASTIGYVHLQAMGSRDLNQWYREFYPIFNRQGLIIDVRHNRGGNIESFILEKLLRKDWMYWKSRTGNPSVNMQYAFRGHIVILVDENTASDGEAFADGFKRLKLGTAIGKRTWGGEIWLSSVNRLSDGGLARAPMFGVYGPEGEWLIEGHGFEPDIEVDNLPHETFNGKDAQLEAAIDLLEKLIKEEPRPLPLAPDYPDKSFDYKD
ncbi:MAG: S41 family peptidase [Bacteroidota bacterium]